MEKDRNHNPQAKESQSNDEWAQNIIRRRIEAARRLSGWAIDKETGEPMQTYTYDWGCDD